MMKKYATPSCVMITNEFEPMMKASPLDSTVFESRTFDYSGGKSDMTQGKSPIWDSEWDQ